MDFDPGRGKNRFVIEGPLASSDGDFEVSISWSPPAGSCAHHYAVLLLVDWKQAGRLASHCAARVVSQLGARLTEKITPEEIEAL